MKNICCAIVLLLFSVIIPLQAQTNEEVQVTAAVENLRKAMISGEKAALENIVAPELTYGHSSGKMEDKAQFIEALTSKQSDFVSIDLTNQTVKVMGNTAIVRHQLSATTNDKGQPGTVKLGVMLVWQKQKGTWKLLARQAFKM